MAQTIKLKRSNTSGSKPTTSNLALGEIALNTKDGLFFLRRYVDGTNSNDTITAYTPEYLTEYDSQIDITVTVDTKTAAHPQYGNGSSNGFLLDGLEGPFLVLVPGNTYRFDQSDSSNSGHPLRFYYESDKTTSFTTGVTTNGTAGSSGAYTQIAVTTSTPTVLYYQCSSHSLMGSGSYCGGGTIVEDQLAANAVTSTKIAANAVTSSEVAANAITSSELAANSVNTAEIASNAITSAHISSGVVIEADVANNAITSAKIAANAVGTSEIASNAITSALIAGDAVGTDEIADNAITSAKIAANQVGISELNVSDGTSGQALTTNGSGTLSFSDVSSTLAGATDSNISSPSSGQILVYDGTDSFDNVSISGDATLSNTGALTIAANAIEASMIAKNAVGSSEIASNSVGIDELNVTDGTSGQVLTTDGAGTLSFSTVSGGGSQNLFSTIAVSGQSDIVADSTTDTLTIAAGSGITLGTNASTDTLTITATGGGGLSANAVTSAYLASNAVLARHIAANAVGSSEIASSGVTSGTYGSSTATPQITVDADGRISNVSNVTISSSGGGSAYGFTNTVEQDSFTGDGSTTSFDTGTTITNENLTWVFIDGVYQQKDSYSVSGSSVVFSAAPPSSTTIEVMHLTETTTGSGLNTNSFNGDGSTTDFTLATTPQSEDDIIAFIGGVFQNQDSYTFSGTTLSFDTAPANGTKIVVYVISGVITGKANIINNFSGDGSTTAFTLSLNPQHENNINVFIDGVYQQKSEFSVSGTTLTFSSAPPSGTDNIEVEINQITTTTSLADNSVTASAIAAGAVGASEIAANAVGSSEIAANAVGVSELASGALNGQTFTGDSEITGEFTANEFIGDLRGAVLFKAQAGEALSKGDVVYISGISGNTTVVSKADADDANKMPAFGIAAAAASINTPVDVYTQGTLSSIDTSSFTVGDELFVSTTAGALTSTAPTGETSKLQKIAKVTRSDASAGSIFITGAGRTNAVPNLDNGDIFIGNASNQAVTASLDTEIESYLDGGTSTPTFASFTMSNNTSTAYDGTADQEGATVRIINTNNTTSDTFADIRFESHSTSTGRARLGMELPSVNNSDLFFVTENSGSLSEKMRITSSGDVGIGTASPVNLSGQTSLTINGSVARVDLQVSQTTTGSVVSESGYIHLQPATGGKAIVGNGGTDLVVDSSGNVGIGTSSPTDYYSDRLVVTAGSEDGITIAAAATTHANYLMFADGTTGNEAYRGYISYDHGSDSLNIASHGFLRIYGGSTTQEFIRIDASGNVGIGTQNPDHKLHVDVGAPGSADKTLAAFSSERTLRDIGFVWDDSASTLGVATLTNHHMAFHTNGNSSERMRITNDGRVGIGTTSPIAGAALDVQPYLRAGNLYVGLDNGSRIEGGNGQIYPGVMSFIAGAANMDINHYVVVTGIGINLSAKLDSPTGDWYTNDGSVSSLSDERVKTDITDLSDGLEIVKQLRPVTFKYNDNSEDEDGRKRMGAASDKVRYGFIAQEVEQVAPQYVETGIGYINNEEVDDFKSMSTTRMIPMLFKAIQEQQTIIDDLKARIETLENN